MISYIAPVPVGNAVRIALAPPQGSVRTRVLRSTTDSFSGADDESASIVFEGFDSGFIDSACLTNGTTYYYATFDYVNGSWVASPVASCVPAATAAFVSDDVLTIVRDRLMAGLKVAVAANQISHDNNYIPVLTAPPVYENTLFPVVTVHLRSDSPSVWALGDYIGEGAYDVESGLSEDMSGALCQVNLEIIAWVVLNPDVRITLRKLIKSILIGNLGVFEQAGLAEIQISQSDTEDFESYNAPVYQTLTNFSCLAPAVVIAPSDPALADVSVSDPFDF